MITAIRDRRLWPWMIITAGATLRAWQLPTALLWYDESFTYLVARLSLLGVLEATGADVHPPFYYAVCWVLLRALPMLQPVLVLRGFSWLCGVLALVLLWRMSEQLQGITFEGRLAGLAFLSLSPVAIYYSQEARMYALLMVLVLLQVLAIQQRRWLCLGLVNLLLIYTHNYALFYLATMALVALAGEIKRPVHVGGDPGCWRPGLPAYTPTDAAQHGQVLLAFALPVLAWLPWMVVLLGQMAMVGVSYWIQPVTGSQVVLAMLRGWVAGSLPVSLQVLAILGLAAGLVLVLISAIKRRQALLLWWALAPLAMAVAASLLWRPVLLYRGLVPLLPAVAMLAGSAFILPRDAGRVGRWLLLVPLGLALLWQIQPVPSGTDHSGSYWAAASAETVYHMEDTSLVVYSANYPLAGHVLIDSGCPEQTAALTDATRTALGIQSMALGELPEHYTLAAGVGPLSSACQERLFAELTGQARELYAFSNTLGVWGMWNYGQ